MIVKITSKRQVTFPARVLDELGVEPGDQLELMETDEGFLLKPRKIDLSRLALLKGKIPPRPRAFRYRDFQDAAL